jgi:membrane-bound serine protease (ClpP class)
MILGTALFGLPVVAILGFKFWPKTAIGRRVLLSTPQSQDVLPDSPRLRALKSLVGKVGRAKGPMLPSGPVVIDGRTIDAMSEGMAIEAGQLVRVVQVRGMEVVVRPAEDGPSLAAQPQAASQDPLSQPIDQLIPDPFQEPPAA